MSETLVEQIKAGRFNRKELENLYANAERLGRAEVQAAAKEALRQIDSRSYAKRFVKPIKDKVEEIAVELATANGWTDFAENAVGNGVKPGGEMLKGVELAEFYISYRKPHWKRAAYLSVFQRDEQDAVRYKVSAHDGEEAIVDTSDEAVTLFKRAVAAA